MRCAPALLAALAIAAAGCESGGSPTVSAQPVSTGSGAPAAVPVGPPQRPDVKRTRGIQRVALVEAAGRGPEVEAFVSRFLSDVGDRDLFAVADARLSGASLAALAADPNGAAASKFREAWPSDAYLAASVGECFIKTQRFVTPDTSQGYRIERVTVTYDATCPVTMKLADPGDGHVLASVEVTGRAKFNGDTESGGTPAEEEAARDAATRAVKKLRSQLGR